MNAIQLELFEPNDELSLLKKEIAEIRSSQDRVRKSQFAKLHEMSKLYIEIKQEYENLKSKIYRNR